MWLFDTNTLIYLIKRRPPQVIERMNALPADARIGMSFISWAELLLGAERSTRKDQVVGQLERLAQVVEVLYPQGAVGSAMCRHYAEQFAALKAKGTSIGANDLWIAAHALAQDATLVARNTREFERIRGLKLEDWVR